jgi:AmmeMemoRadiSam system protein A
MTVEPDRRALLLLARAAIEAHIGGAAPPHPSGSAVFEVRSGAFVTLHRSGELRGCIGHIGGDDSLGEVIPRCAIAAATEDPRFPAIRAAEIRELDIELSLLGPLQEISGPDEVEIGRDGLVVESGWQRGLLLPQVATEWKWDAEAFLAHTCRKAGLPADAWRRGAKLWRFEAEVFSDSQPRALRS